MDFGNLKQEQGIDKLNKYLRDRSYIVGYEPSAQDFKIFEELAKAPAPLKVDALRWYNHIKSFSAEERKALGDSASPMSAGSTTTAAPTKPADDDDDVDLFGSDEEDDAAAEKLREERVKAYAEKKSKKPALIAKSSIVLDVKPWDDETDMKNMEEQVRTIVMDGLIWGASKLVPLAYGIKKLQIICVVEDEKVSVDLLVEKIQEFEDFVQSVDIAAFNKI